MSGPRPVRAPRGTSLATKGWLQEAALRCLMNNLDPEVAENPDELVVYGGRGKAARTWEAYDAIVRTLTGLGDEETLLVQSGKPVGVFETHRMAPRVLIANSLLVPDWATLDHFWDLEAAGLMMYGQMTAGSWIYIGTQGILQGTFQTFAAIADQRFGGTLKGTITLTAGLGGMGGAQPLAVTMNDGVAICVEVDRARIQRRLDTRYLDEVADNLDDAVERAMAAKAERRALSIAVEGNAADVFPKLVNRGVEIEIVTDQTSAHDPLNGYVPRGYTLAEAAELRAEDRSKYVEEARDSMARHCAAMVGFMRAGAEVFDYGNNLRGEAKAGGFADAFAYPGFVPAYLRPLFCEGKGPFRWVALSGDPRDIAVTDRALLDLFPEDRALHRWLPMAAEQVAFQGLPSRICWLGYGERDKAGLAFNDLVRSGKVSAPIVIGRDHLDAGSVASPYRETEGMIDGSDAVADWPILNALLNTASGAAWVAVHHGGGVGIGKSIHSGAQVVADGTGEGAERLRRVLTNDPGTGVMRHADAGYERAIDVAGERASYPDAGVVSADLLVTGIGELVTNAPGDDLLGIVEHAAVVVRDGGIRWVGAESDLPADLEELPTLDAEGRAAIPGFVDSHTHLVFGGDRSGEFARRLRGESYEQILAAGGGIHSTVAATRAASDDELVADASARAERMLRLGTTTVEVKSGYGLDTETEIRMLEVAREVGERLPIDVATTFLGAHVVAAGWESADYVNLVVEEMLPACAPLTDFCDVFCDAGAFSVDEARRVLEAGLVHGLKPRLHADQLARTGAARLAAEMGAMSADHLDHVTADDAAALRDSGVVAVLLPAASFSMRSPQAPGRMLWDAGVTVALATDCNPGTSNVESMPMVVAIACLEMGLTPEEALWAATRGGALALGLADRGWLGLGAVGDFVLLDAPSYLHIPYRPGTDLVSTVVKAGIPVG